MREKKPKIMKEKNVFCHARRRLNASKASQPHHKKYFVTTTIWHHFNEDFNYELKNIYNLCFNENQVSKQGITTDLAIWKYILYNWTFNSTHHQLLLKRKKNQQTLWIPTTTFILYCQLESVRPSWTRINNKKEKRKIAKEKWKTRNKLSFACINSSVN